MPWSLRRLFGREPPIRARFMRTLDDKYADKRLFELSKPVLYDRAGYTWWVVVSGAYGNGNPSTVILPSNASGDIADWKPLPGSFQGDIDHDKAIARAGWKRD